MEFKDLKKIIDLIKSNDIAELELQDGEFRLSAKLNAPHAAPVMVTQQHAALPPTAGAPAPVPVQKPVEPGLTVDSPMVGTFYRSPSPESESFSKVGDSVDADSVVCIVEAMKVMNEIKAEKKGTIKKILVDNGEAVEFGQPLFELEPA